ncbi:MHO_4530 family protein [Mycoplasma sp. 1018B]|uniref:MHO_4530 family protein n=1 Tax=Mycoplasma sp. 1018B TaxID=2967302 RepID=UPI00211CF917|nr:hypothetical protein [Mycoplasma sp. 1018B]UUM19012.1 hypothetical protein NPA14_01575 [Mycoplasma sp. 1018B]
MIIEIILSILASILILFFAVWILFIIIININNKIHKQGVAVYKINNLHKTIIRLNIKLFNSFHHLHFVKKNIFNFNKYYELKKFIDLFPSEKNLILNEYFRINNQEILELNFIKQVGKKFKYDIKCKIFPNKEEKNHHCVLTWKEIKILNKKFPLIIENNLNSVYQKKIVGLFNFQLNENTLTNGLNDDFIYDLNNYLHIKFTKLEVIFFDNLLILGQNFKNKNNLLKYEKKAEQIVDNFKNSLFFKKYFNKLTYMSLDCSKETKENYEIKIKFSLIQEKNYLLKTIIDDFDYYKNALLEYDKKNQYLNFTEQKYELFSKNKNLPLEHFYFLKIIGIEKKYLNYLENDYWNKIKYTYKINKFICEVFKDKKISLISNCYDLFKNFKNYLVLNKKIYLESFDNKFDLLILEKLFKINANKLEINLILKEINNEIINFILSKKIKTVIIDKRIINTIYNYNEQFLKLKNLEMILKNKTKIVLMDLNDEFINKYKNEINIYYELKSK